MFKKQLIAASLMLFATGASFICYIFHVSGHDLIEYQQLMEAHLMSQEFQAPTASFQDGNSVTKEMWAGPLSLRLLSEHVQTQLCHEEGAFTAAENLFNVSCFMQEELFYILPDGREAVMKEGAVIVRNGNPEDPDDVIDPLAIELVPMQTVRHFQAESAHAHYQKQTLKAENVHLRSYRLKGHVLPDTIVDAPPLMEGFAQEAEISWKSEKGYQFQANKLKMIFDAKRGVL